MRVSVTNIDSLAYCLAADMDLADIICRLRHLTPPTEQQRAGQAFHHILKYPPTDALETVERHGHRFTFAFDGELRLPAIRELKAETTIAVDGIEVTLVGKVDCLHGTRVDDHKLSAAFSAERYTEAFQWRAYLWLFQAHQFRYNVFPASQLKDGTWRVRGCETLDFYRYPGLEADVKRRLAGYVDFCAHYMA